MCFPLMKETSQDSFLTAFFFPCTLLPFGVNKENTDLILMFERE